MFNIVDFVRSPDDGGGAGEVAEAPAPEPKADAKPEPKSEAKQAPAKDTREAVDRALDKVDLTDKDFEENDPEFDAYGDDDGKEPKEVKSEKEDKPQKGKQPRKAAKKDAAAEPEEGEDEEDTDQGADDRDEQDEDADVDEQDQGTDGDDGDDEDEGADDEFADPPRRFSSEAKQAWAKAPVEVRSEVNRALEELQGGIEKYREAAEAYAEFQPFHEVLKQNGQRFEEVLAHYTGMERMLAQNPVAGFRQIAANLGTSLEQIASTVLNTPLDQRTQAYLKHIHGLQSEVTRMGQALQHSQNEVIQLKREKVQAEVDAFMEKHPRVAEDNEFAKEVAFFLNSGKAATMEEAYERAERQLPPRKAKPKPSSAGNSDGEKDKAAQTRKPPKSIAGAPGRGSNPKDRTPAKTPGQAVDRALRQVGY